MDNNAVEKIPGTGSSEETAILDVIENGISARTKDTTVDMEITGVNFGNIGVHVKSTRVGINTPGVQGTAHEYNNNEGEYYYTSEISDEDIPEEDVHHPQIISPTEQWIYNLIQIKPRNNPGVDCYEHVQILHYVMT